MSFDIIAVIVKLESFFNFCSFSQTSSETRQHIRFCLYLIITPPNGTWVLGIFPNKGAFWTSKCRACREQNYRFVFLRLSSVQVMINLRGIVVRNGLRSTVDASDHISFDVSDLGSIFLDAVNYILNMLAAKFQHL